MDRSLLIQWPIQRCNLTSCFDLSCCRALLQTPRRKQDSDPRLLWLLVRTWHELSIYESFTLYEFVWPVAIHFEWLSVFCLPLHKIYVLYIFIKHESWMLQEFWRLVSKISINHIGQVISANAAALHSNLSVMLKRRSMVRYLFSIMRIFSYYLVR